MSNYEFWDELGKIFNAVVAYQEKTVEFNKRFINPWIRLGNVFDKQDRNKEAVSAYEKAIEIDPDNAQNWFELGNVHFKMGSYEEAITAFNKSIDLDPHFGWPYCNLALALVSQGKHIQAIPLYRKSIGLLAEDKDKAVAWNRLGNVYRKLNEYALAVDAFQKADELDHENAGFRDDLDEAPEEPRVVEADDAPSAAEAMSLTVGPIELIVADSHAEEAASASSEQPTVFEASTEVPTQPAAVPTESVDEVAAPVDEASEAAEAESSEPVLVIDVAQPQDAVASEPAAVEPETVGVASDADPVDAPVEAAVELAAVSAQIPNDAAVVVPDETEQPQAEIAVESEASADGPAAEMAAAIAEDVTAQPDPAAEQPAEITASAEQLPLPAEESTIIEQTVSVVVQTTVETFTETLTVIDTATETSDAGLTMEEPQAPVSEPVAVSEDAVLEAVDQPAETAPVESISSELEAPAEAPLQVDVAAEAPALVEAIADAPAPVDAVAEAPLQVEVAAEAPAQVEAVEEPAAEMDAVQTDAVSTEQPAESAPQELETPIAAEATTVASVDVDSEAPIAEVPAADAVVTALPETPDAVNVVAAVEAQPEGPIAQAVDEVESQVVDTPAEPGSPAVVADDHVAYEEYLKDNNEPVGLFEAEAGEEVATPEDLVAAEEPVTKLDSTGDLQIEMDTKNAHVWNELGNVYFNTGAFDDAVVAYSKAIELDRWFAWPYSNLALAYVQKARFAEAILLYQRSIELFGSDKDKAISWNRLGNVYRRMNDYDNAICAYQRADELDPDNTTLSMQSRFSLLGSYAMEEKPSYAS